MALPSPPLHLDEVLDVIGVDAFALHLLGQAEIDLIQLWRGCRLCGGVGAGGEIVDGDRKEAGEVGEVVRLGGFALQPVGDGTGVDAELAREAGAADACGLHELV